MSCEVQLGCLAEDGSNIGFLGLFFFFSLLYGCSIWGCSHCGRAVNGLRLQEWTTEITVMYQCTTKRLVSGGDEELVVVWGGGWLELGIAQRD